MGSNSPPMFDTEMSEDMPEEDFFTSAMATDSPGAFATDTAFASSPYHPPTPAKSPNGPAQRTPATNGVDRGISTGNSPPNSASNCSEKAKRQATPISPVVSTVEHGLLDPSSEPPTGIKAEPEPLFLAVDLSVYGTPAFVEPGVNLERSSDESMENHFDFDSAANSPSPPLLNNASPYSTQRHVAIPYRDSPRPASKSRQPHSRSSTGTGDGSPLSFNYPNMRFGGMYPAFDTSPATSNEEYPEGIMMQGREKRRSFGNTYEQDPGICHPLGIAMPNSPPIPGLPHSSSPPFYFPPAGASPSRLVIHPTPVKSRVETQIRMTMTLDPAPAGVKRLHLPPHTISKPKMLARPPPAKSPDMLELSTTLVCSSAMRDPHKLHAAFCKAASEPSEAGDQDDRRRASAGDANAALENENAALNGGEVVICAGCVNRERKRAARKKLTKPEEEELWQRDEKRRIIFLNTTEVRDWHAPASLTLGGEGQDEIFDEDGDPLPRAEETMFTTGALQIELPVRIACYCRHHQEKEGYQIIFTIKDHEGKLIAQAITKSIMITDDHKAHGAVNTAQTAEGVFVEQSSDPGQMFVDRGLDYGPGPGPGGVLGPGPSDNFGIGLPRNARSATDLPHMRHSFDPQPRMQSTAPYAVPWTASHNTTTTLTPRSLSRQPSPSIPTTNGIHKKRKANSGPIKLPDALQMTKLQTEASSAPQSQRWSAESWAAGNVFPASPNLASPFGSSGPYSASPHHASNRSGHFFTNPPTPNNDGAFHDQASRSRSFENLVAMGPRYPVSQSARPSRAPSPLIAPQPMISSASFTQTGQMRSYYPSAGAALPQRLPTIHKLIPAEGPKSGGIEVSLFGRGFQQGMEIMFGDSLATTTTFWGDTSLVCLLPPAVRAGTVPITFKHLYLRRQTQSAQLRSQPAPKQNLLFTYVDDDEQQLLRQALLIVNQKMNGTTEEDASDIARRIILDRNSPSPANGGDHACQVTGFGP